MQRPVALVVRPLERVTAAGTAPDSHRVPLHQRGGVPRLITKTHTNIVFFLTLTSDNPDNMKRINSFCLILTALMLLSACNPEPQPTPVDPVEAASVFDLYVCAVKHGGMGQNKNGTYVRQVTSLEADQPEVEFTGRGIDITQKYTMESITRGKYYYQVPQEATGGFVKFHIVRDEAGNESVVVDAERPFGANTYYPRKYTHAWLDNGETLLVMGTDAEHKTVYWSKLRESDMAVISEGTMDIKIPSGYSSLSTSGILTQTPSGTLYYIYHLKPADENAKPLTRVAIIDILEMEVAMESSVPEKVMEETVSAAYGELMQSLVTYDESGNMYVAGMVTIDGTKYGVLRRITAGKTSFDPDWNGFPDPEGRLLTVQYVGGGKILAYSRDETLGTKIDSRSHFYTLIDTKTCQRERVSCNGTPLRYCSGRYSQRTAVDSKFAYIGVTEGDGEDEYPQVYIYDKATGTVSPGVKLSRGFCFDLIRIME